LRYLKKSKSLRASWGVPQKLNVFEGLLGRTSKIKRVCGPLGAYLKNQKCLRTLGRTLAVSRAVVSPFVLRELQESHLNFFKEPGTHHSSDYVKPYFAGFSAFFGPAFCVVAGRFNANFSVPLLKLRLQRFAHNFGKRVEQ
jgi:hypothetical protein